MRDRQFGNKLRLVRERKGMTLKEVAEKAGVSESLVSQIERNRVSPSVDTLLNISEALGVHPEYLFRESVPAGELIVTRHNTGPFLGDRGTMYRSLYARGDISTGKGMEVFTLDVDPGAQHGDVEYGHKGTEVGVVLQGRALLFYGNERIELNEGDCVSFQSDIPHTIQNPGTEQLKTLWFVSPPRIFKPRG